MPAPFGPGAVALSNNTGGFYHINADGAVVETLAHESTVNAMEFDDDRNFYYWDYDSATATRELYKIAADGSGPTLIYSSNTITWFCEAMQYANGKLYCLVSGDSGDPLVVVFDTDGNLLDSDVIFSPTPPELIEPNPILPSVNADGSKLYLSAYYSPDGGTTESSRVYEIDTSTWAATVLLDEPYGTNEHNQVWKALNGHVFVWDDTTRELNEYDAAGAFIRLVMSNPLPAGTLTIDGVTQTIPLGGDKVELRDDTNSRVHGFGDNGHIVIELLVSSGASMVGQSLWSYDPVAQAVTKQRDYPNATFGSSGISTQVYSWAIAPGGVCADVVLAADVQGNIYRKRTDTGEWATVYSYSPVGDPGENFVRNLMTAGTATNVVVGLLDTDVFGAWNRNVIYSTNGGSTWIVGGSITHQFGQAYPNLLAVSDDGTAIYYVNATGALGVFRSTDWGANWTKIADEFTATLDDRSVWSKGNHVWWQTRSGTSRLLGRCELDGSNRTSFALPSVTHDQMMGSAIDDVLVCFSSAGVQNIAGNQHIVVTDADGTPSGTQSAQIDAGWAAFPTEDYRGAVVTPISASLVVAKVNNLSGGAPTSPILLYTSASGTGTWTQRVSDPDANGQSSYNGLPATVSPDGTEVWQLLTLPHVWKSINGGVNWTSEDVPGLVDDGQNAWSALAYAHTCGLPPGDEEPPTIFPGFSRTQKADAARHHYTRAS